jgi:N-acetylglutamate synthase-like GNAT family acetyltransferase
MSEPVIQLQREGYVISTDKEKLDVAAIHAYLTRSYWSPGIPKAVVERAIEGALCFGVYTEAGQQVGFARAITDRATFAYLADVYVLEEHRGRGLGKWLLEAILAHPALQGLRRILLATRDAHGLYEQFGFKPLVRPESFMEIHRPNTYA